MPNRRGPGATRPVEAASGDGPDTLEVTDLGERRIADRLDVPPASIPKSRGWLRPSPVLVVIGAIALVAMAIGGPDGQSPRNVTASGDPGAVASSEPTATADPCPPDGLPDPTVAIGPRSGRSSASDTIADRWASPASAGFTPPVDRFADARAGDYMVLRVTPAGCVADLRVDVQATGITGGDGLGVPTRRTGDGRGWGLFAPPAGDWTVRIAMRLRRGTTAGDEWAIYFLRLRVDGVGFVEPIPVGGEPAGGGNALVTPTRPCQDPDPGGTLPPEVALTIGDVVVPGALGAYTWAGTMGQGVDAEGLAVTSLGLDGLPTLTIAGDRCAVGWRILAGPVPAPGAPFEAGLSLHEMTENPMRDPAIAAQNEFQFYLVPLGEFVLVAELEFGTTDRATIYWRLEIASPDVPAGAVGTRTAGSLTPLTVGCGTWLEVIIDNRGLVISATTPCWGLAGESWPAVPDGSDVDLTAGDLLRVDIPGHAIRDWMLEYDLRIGEPGSSRVLGSGYFETPPELIDIPAPPPGEWIVRLWLSVETEVGRMGIPYYFLLDVAA